MQQYTQHALVDTNSGEFLAKSGSKKARPPKFTSDFRKARLFRFKNHVTYALDLLRKNPAANLEGRALEVKPVQIVYSPSLN